MSGGTAGAAGRGHRAPPGPAFVRGAGGTDGNAAALAALCAWNKEQPEASFAVQKWEGAREGNVTRQRWQRVGGAQSSAIGPETGSTSLALPAGTSMGTVGTLMSPEADLPCCDAGLHSSRQSGVSSSKTPGAFPGEVRFMWMHHGLRADSLPPSDRFSPCDLPCLFISTGCIASTPCLVTLRSSAWRLPSSVRTGGKPSISSLTHFPSSPPPRLVCPMPRQSPAHPFSCRPRAAGGLHPCTGFGASSVARSWVKTRGRGGFGMPQPYSHSCQPAAVLAPNGFGGCSRRSPAFYRAL